MWNRKLVPASFCAVVLACGGGDESGDWNGTVTDSAGVQIIANPATGLWSEGSEWQLTEDLRIGSSEGDPDYQFGQIVGITVGEQGNIFVLDQQAAQIREFDKNGTFIRSIGKVGGGPGEIGAQGAAALINAAADTLSVADLANMRVQHFLENGSPAGNYRIDMAAGMPMRWQDTPEGLAVVQIRPGMFDTEASADSMDAIVVRSTDGTTTDTLLRVPGGETFSMAGGTPEIKFFSPEPFWTLAPGVGIWYGVNNKYELGLYDTSGQLVRKLRKPFVPSPVSDRDQEIMIDMMKRIFESRPGMPPQVAERLLSVIQFGDNFPAYLQILSGPQSSLWVQHIQVPSELTEEEIANFNPLLSMGSSSWDVFDAEGRFLGVIEMPDRFQPLRFLNDKVFGVWRDDLDVQYVMSLRIGTSGDQPATVDIGE